MKVARDYNKTLGAGEGISPKEKLFESLAQIHGDELRTLATEASNRFSNQYTWSPMMRATRTSRISIQDLEKLYCNPTYNKSESRPTKYVQIYCIITNDSLITYDLLIDD